MVTVNNTEQKSLGASIMKKIIIGWSLVVSAAVSAQTYDSSTLVDTNNTSTSTSTVNSTNVNTNTNVNTSTSTVDSTSVNTNVNTNTNTTTSTSVNTNNNINSGDQTVRNINSGEQTFNNNNVNTSTNVNTTTSTNVNTNNNINSGEQTFNNNNNITSNNVNTTTSDNTNRNIQSGDMTNRNINTGDMTNRNITQTQIEQTLRQPPPTTVAPAMMSGGNSDLCTTGTSGAVQTQILGVSSGGTVRDLNCERLKNAKTLYDMGMKVAAVATLCQDRRVFDAMWHAGTPCPYEGMIGERAKTAWNENPDKIPPHEKVKSDDFYRKTGFGAILGALLFRVF
jgi:hypothetical protein